MATHHQEDEQAHVRRPSAPVLCRTTLTYFPGTGPAATEHGSRQATIHDGRRADLPGWQECGFELLAHESATSDWADDDEIKRVHYPEMAALAAELSGCDHALVSSHIKRNPDEAARHRDLGPIALVHSDFADSYGDKVRGMYREPGPDTREALAAAGIGGDVVTGARRLLILQFWRNLGPAKMDLPLAFCDARTVGRLEIRPFPVTNYAGGGFDFDALGVVAPGDPSDHAWYAFDSLQPDEVVAFRTYDTDRVEDGRPYWTPHSAFRDPAVPLGAPSRSSIELRATCVFA